MHLKKLIKQLSTFDRLSVAAIFLCLPLTMSLLLNDPFTVIKWDSVYLFSLCALFHLLFLKKQLFLPQISKAFAWSFCAIIVLWGAGYEYFQIPWVSAITAGRIFFIVLALFFCGFFKENPQGLKIIAYAIGLSIIFFVILFFVQHGFGLLKHFFDETTRHCRKDFAFTFNNENMAAQYFSAAFLFVLYIFHKAPSPLIKSFSAFALLLTALLLWKTSCRSAMLGVGAGTAFYCVMRLPLNYRKASLVMGGLLIAGSLIASLLMRKETVTHRQEMWSNALHMAKKYPQGVGRGRFSFYHTLEETPEQVIPPLEELVELTPHNEFLKYLTEEGWAFMLLCAALIAFFLKKHGKFLYRKLDQSHEFQLICALGIFTLSEMAFQFPFENAYPFLIITVIVGYILSILPRHKKIHLYPAMGVLPFLLITSIALRLIAGDILYGSFRENPLGSKIGCALSPNHQQLCIFSLQNMAGTQEPIYLIEKSYQELIKRPYNFLALIILSRGLFTMNNKENYCEVVSFYDRIFYGNHRFKKYMHQDCPKELLERHKNLSVREQYRKLFNILPEDLRLKLIRNT